MLKLQPGDHLLYSGKGIFSWLIKVKTWSRFSHVEIYLGYDQSFASRDGKGVRVYWFRQDDLAAVLRPRKSIDTELGMKWAHENRVIGQKYDWWGLFRFFTFGTQSTTKQFCSEAAVRFDKACGFYPFHEKYDADLVSPGMFYSSPEFDVIWEDLTDGQLE
jgi:hypothetical protein